MPSETSFNPTAPLETEAYISPKQGAPFELGTIVLPPMTETSVQVDIIATGLCHTDIHMVNNDWGVTDYPFVAGHEGLGVVTHVGSAVKTHAIGDRVMLGWIRDSCTACRGCMDGRENLCEDGFQGLYLGPSAGMWGNDKRLYHTKGGCFARKQRIEARFATKLPDAIPLDMACPLTCGGGTVWEPICNFCTPGKRVGVVGIGGLGLLAVKLAKLNGCIVVGISRTESKREATLKAGASEFWVVSDESTKPAAVDVLIDTRPANAPVEDALNLVGFGGVVARVGIPLASDQKGEFNWIPHIFTSKQIVGSAVTGSKRMKSMFDIVEANMPFMLEGNEGFGKAEQIPFSEVNEAIGKLSRGENKGYRYVLMW